MNTPEETALRMIRAELEAERVARRALAEALQNILAWAECVAPRAGVRMGDTNTGAATDARAALALAAKLP